VSVERERLVVGNKVNSPPRYLDSGAGAALLQPSNSAPFVGDALGGAVVDQQVRSGIAELRDAMIKGGIVEGLELTARLNFVSQDFKVGGVSYDFFDLFQRWFTTNDNLHMIAGVGAQFSATVAASTSLLSTEDFFNSVGGAAHTGVFDLEVQFEDDGKVAVTCIAYRVDYAALNSPDLAYRGANAGADSSSTNAGVGNFGPWVEGGPFIDGLYSVDRFNAPNWTTVAHPLDGPLTNGLHRVAYSFSPALCLYCLDAGPVFSRVPDQRLDFGLLNEIDLYMYVNGPNAVATLKNASFYRYTGDARLLRRMSAL
jgi:hypothetical protein